MDLDFPKVIISTELLQFLPNCSNSRIEFPLQRPQNILKSYSLGLSTFMSQSLLLFLVFHTISFAEQHYNSINTDKALSLLQCHLQKVAKYQHILEILTNNVLINFVT